MSVVTKQLIVFFGAQNPINSVTKMQKVPMQVTTVSE